MLQNYSGYRILEQFFDFPRRQYHIRELSRILRLAQPSVRLHLNRLLKEKLVLKLKEGLYPTYLANRDNELFKLLKAQNIVYRLKKSGFIEFLEKRTWPKSIVLFGSTTLGEDIETSDIDIFIFGNTGKLPTDNELKPYEIRFRRKIHILEEKHFGNLTKELKNNLVNGIVLYGYLKAFSKMES